MDAITKTATVVVVLRAAKSFALSLARLKNARMAFFNR
jgi:hypothetical protein